MLPAMVTAAPSLPSNSDSCSKIRSLLAMRMRAPVWSVTGMTTRWSLTYVPLRLPRSMSWYS